MVTELKTTELIPSKSPNLLVAPVEYSQQYQDQINNALRLYFNQIDNFVQSVGQTVYATNSMPAGGIIMWSGATADVPAGWNLCDGTNGTPDLRNKFLVGAGSTYSVGDTGGSANATLVSHTHTASVTDPGHTHTISDPGHGHGFGWSGSLFGGSSGIFAGDFVGGGTRGIGIPTSVGADAWSGGLSINSNTTGITGTNSNTTGHIILLPA